MSVKITLLPHWLMEILSAEGLEVSDYTQVLKPKVAAEFNKAQSLVGSLISKLGLGNLDIKFSTAISDSIGHISKTPSKELLESVVGGKILVDYVMNIGLLENELITKLETKVENNNDEIILYVATNEGSTSLRSLYNNLLLSLHKKVGYKELRKTTLFANLVRLIYDNTKILPNTKEESTPITVGDLGK